MTTSCSVFRMFKWCAVLLLAVSPVLAQEGGTAYDALRTISTQLNRGYVDRVISVTGDGGNPQPATWKVLVEDHNARISSERTPIRTVVGSTEGATIKTSRLNLDSSGAFAVASHTADKSGTQFQNVSYTLRTDERGEPVWIVTLHAHSGQPVGTIFIGANRGTVTRTEGMFAGATMQDVQTDQEVSNPEEGHGPFSHTKARIRESFQHAQEGARGMFDRVKRSFEDFINRT
jgi:hypothetical protein